MTNGLTIGDVLAALNRLKVTKRELAAAIGIQPSQMTPIFDESIEVSQEYLKKCLTLIENIAGARVKPCDGQDTAA